MAERGSNGPDLPDYGNLSSPDMVWFAIQGESGLIHLAFCDGEWVTAFQQEHDRVPEMDEIVTNARFVISADLHYLDRFTGYLNDTIHGALDEGHPWIVPELMDPSPYSGVRRRVKEAYQQGLPLGQESEPTEERKGKMWDDIDSVIRRFDGPNSHQ